MSQFKTKLQQGVARITKVMAVAFFVAVPLVSTVAPAPTALAADEVIQNCNPTFLGIPAWYRGLATGPDCAIEMKTDLATFIWTIALNVIEMLLVAVVYIAVGFIIYGGFIWLTGGSSPQQVAKGRKTILNAAIGLVIAMGAIALNNLLFNNLVK